MNPNLLQVLSYGYTEGYTDALATFSKQQPSAAAALTTGPFPTKFLTLAAAGTPPDVVFVPSGGNVVDFVNKQLLRSLDDYARTSQVVADDFFSPAWKENIVQGKMYAVTNEVDPNFPLVYNTTLLQQAGIDKPPATIQDLDAANDKLYQNQGGEIKRLGMLPPWHTYGAGNTLTTYFAMFGGGYLDPNDPTKLAITQPANAAGLQWIKQYADRYGGYDAIEAFAKARDNLSVAKGYVSALAQGQIVMGPMVSANCASMLKAAKETQYADAFQLTLLPVAAGVTPDPGWLGGWGFGLPNGTKRPDDAWKLLHWMCMTPDGTASWAEINRFMPGYKKSTFYTMNATDLLVSGYLKVLEGARHIPPILGDVPGSPSTDLVNNVSQGKVAVSTALEQYRQVVQPAFEKVKDQVQGAF